MKLWGTGRAGLAVLMAVAGVVAVNAPAGAAAAWTVVASGAGAQYGRLASVSCVSTTSCVAVGVADTPTATTKLVERWNGAQWSVAASPNPAGAGSSQFSSVHCLTSTSCFAVGQYSVGLVTKTLAERWNGTRWSVTASPNPAATAVSGLSSVQCLSTTLCIAVGSYFVSTVDSSAEQTLVERWNGSAWSIVASPNRVTADDSGLAGVSCPSSTSCWAVGHSDTTIATNTLVEHWNGTSWSIVASPDPANNVQNELTGVSCAGPNRCVAVGLGHGTLAERWNGTSWSLMTTPNPSGSTGASLAGVSCPLSTRCYAVSDSFKGRAVQRLVETWNATSWSIVATPVPTGTVRSSLSGVACVTTASCFAVGEYRLGPSPRPLINRYS